MGEVAVGEAQVFSLSSRVTLSGGEWGNPGKKAIVASFYWMKVLSDGKKKRH